MPKSLDELSHAENWLNLRLQRQKSRINNFFGKNAVLSIIGLSYRAAPMMKKVAKTIEKRLNSMRHGVSNGNEESMNNKIRMLRIKAR
ncbi:hypothetical protein [Escherichia coli]|uniref:hypothetical protein n=1 Tax=Escherichia coli TaxID=562 RepID=UPI0038D4F932